MKILLINYEYPPVGGGASNATGEMAAALANLGHEPVVLTARFRNRLSHLADPRIKLIEIPARRLQQDRSNIFEMSTFAISAMWRIRHIIHKEQIDAAIAFFSIPGGPIAWWGCKKINTPYIVSLRGGDVPGNEPSLAALHHLLRPLRRTVLRHARAIVANSKVLRDAAEKADPFPVKMIPNGVDPKRWYSDADREHSKSFRFLFVGRLQPQKNLGWLLRRMAEVRDISPTLSWELGIVGDGSQKAEMLRLASELNLGERIRWFGWLDQTKLRALYANSDLLITPALYEGMPNAVLEAMACGLPVCASAIPSHAELIVHRQNGILFPLDEDKPFGNCLLEILTNPGVVKIWGAGAQRRVTELFSWEKVAESYLRLLSPQVSP